MLERMEEADAFSAELKAAEAALKADQADVAKELQQLDADRAKSRSGAETRDRGSDPGREQDFERRARRFDRVAHGRKGLAVAEARDGLCTVCHVRLRPQVFNEVRRNDSLIQCDSCTRILFFVPVQSATAPQPQ